MMEHEACVNPDELREGDLMAYVDGTAETSVVRHVRACPACTQQAAKLAALQAVMVAGLHRQTCPEGEQLAAYEQGELRGGQRLLVAQHLRQCPHCPLELAALVREERTPLGERVRATLQVFVASLATPPPRPEAAQLRGPYSAPRVYDVGRAQDVDRVPDADRVQVLLSQRPAPHQPGLWDLSGLIASGNQVPPGIDRARVELYAGDGLIAVVPVSDRGQFVLPALEPGQYDLSLVWREREIRLEGVKMP